MLFSTFSLLSKTCIRSAWRTVTAVAAQEVQEIQDIKDVKDTNNQPFDIGELCPTKHTVECLNRIYVVPSHVSSILKKFCPNEIKKQATVFRELGILIRKPAIEVIECLEQTDYKKPINKYVLYGETGIGKTTTLLHLVHYGLMKKFIVVYLPWVQNWFRFPKEVAKSPLEPDKLDLPVNAVEWLQFFKALNKVTLSQFNLKVSKTYTWPPREDTKEGDSFSNLIEFGIQRPKFACGVINAILNELKTASITDQCRTLIVIDGFNAFISDYTNVRDENHVHVSPDKITITSAFMNSVDHNWFNSAAILTVDKTAVKDRRNSDYPVYLLGEKGFKYLNPFLPIEIKGYSNEELKTILEYYTYRKWIRNISPQGQRELELLSNNNPYDIWQLCKPL